MGIAIGFAQHFGVVISVIPPEEVERAGSRDAALQLHLRPGRRRVIGHPLPTFLESSFALVLGAEITRREVIQYVANKLGGAHYDATRTRRGDDRLELLDRLANTNITIEGLQPVNAVYIELLSIASFVAESGDAARFRGLFERASLRE